MQTTVNQTTNKIQPSKYVMVGWRLSIIAICTSILIAGGIVGIVGLIFSCKRKKNAVTSDQVAKVKTGKTLSIVSIVLGSVVLITLALLFALLLWKFIVW